MQSKLLLERRAYQLRKLNVVCMRGAREANLPFIGLHIAGKHRDQNNAAVTATKASPFPACSSQDLAARQVTTRSIIAVSFRESSSYVHEFLIWISRPKLRKPAERRIDTLV